MRWLISFVILMAGMHHCCGDDAGEAADERVLRVFSNNVGIFPQHVVALYPKNLKQKKKAIVADEAERAALLARSLMEFAGDPDVLLLQEIWSLKAKDVLIKDLAQRYPYFWHPPLDRASLLAMLPSGLMVFSKYPLNDCAYKEFTRGIGVDKMARKGIIGARLTKHGKTVSVFTTHLQAGGKRDPTVRPDQLRECNEFIRKFTGDDEDAVKVLAGDFNIDSTNPAAYGEIFTRLTGAIDSYRDGSGLIKGTTRNQENPNKRIDYLFTFGAGEATSVIVDPAGHRIADHLSVFGKIVLD